MSVNHAQGEESTAFASFVSLLPKQQTEHSHPQEQPENRKHSENLENITRRYRSTRYEKELLAPLDVDAYFLLNNQRIALTIENFSEFGLRFSCPLAADLLSQITVGTILKELVFSVDKKPVFSGEVRVSYRHTDDSKVELGVFCTSGTVQIQSVFNSLTARELKTEFEYFMKEASLVDKIAPPFKAAINDLRFFLEGMKTYLLRSEEKIKIFPKTEDQNAIEKTLISFTEKSLQEKILALLVHMDSIVANFSKAEHELHHRYFQRQLLPLTKDSVFFRRALEKPLGYAGDYEMMNMLYHGMLLGDSLWSKLLNSCLTNIPSGWAVRNRAHYLKEKIKQIITKKKGKGPVSILSLACGPCEEIQMLLAESSGNDLLKQKIDFYLVDHDPCALAEVQHSLYAELQQKNDSLSFSCFNHSVRQFMKAPLVLLSCYPKMDFIYSAGLYDYLPDPAAERLTQVTLEMLSQDGLLVIGNFNDSHPIKFFIEYAANWFLIRRDPERLQRLASNNASYSRLAIEEEESGVNSFLNIWK